MPEERGMEMDEYIKKETAYRAIMWERPEAREPSWFAELVLEIPAADVAPVRHGRWLSWDELHGGNMPEKNVLGVFCSECIRQSDSKTDFCQNCGANMRGISYE